jgi:hypothetical protein
VTAPVKILVSLCLLIPAVVSASEPGLLIDTVIRGQSPAAAVPTAPSAPTYAPVYAPTYDPTPVTGYPAATPPTTWMAMPVMQTGNPMGIVPAPGVQAAPWAAQPTPGQVPGGMTFGAHASLQPYRLNAWTGRVEGGFLPRESTEGRLGQFGVTELDVELEFSGLFMPGWIFSFTQIADSRWWDGPSDPGVDADPPATPLPTSGNGLPARVYRIGWDLELATINQGGYSAQLAFTPSMATDFDNGVDSDSWQFDGRGVIYYKYPGMTIALGAGYWDRVKDRVIPYAGVIFKPDSIWEWQLMFPQSRISVFLGNYGGNSSWMYTKAEYHVESYDMTVQRTHGGAPIRDQVEFEDYRLMMGFRSEALQYSSFIEAGWVFGREARFGGPTPGFDIADGFIGRAGISF